MRMDLGKKRAILLIRTDKRYKKDKHFIIVLCITYLTVPLRFLEQGFPWKLIIANNLISGCRLDNMDTYSNLLYVKEQRVELAHLAHRYYMQETLLYPCGIVPVSNIKRKRQKQTC
jgi:hypothetical protein